MIKKSDKVKKINFVLDDNERMYIELEVENWLRDSGFSTIILGRAMGQCEAGLKRLGYELQDIDLILKDILNPAFYGGVYFAYNNRNKIKIVKEDIGKVIKMDDKKENNEAVG